MSGKLKSIITNDLEHDVITGEDGVVIHHCIFGNGLRKLADEDGLIIPLTPFHHNCADYMIPASIHGGVITERLSKMVGQLAWEKEYYRKLSFENDPARDAFRRRYGRSYL